MLLTLWFVFLFIDLIAYADAYRRYSERAKVTRWLLLPGSGFWMQWKCKREGWK